MLTLKKTKLFEEHIKCSAKMVDFNGFEMPLQYTGIIAEHNAVRNHAGIFDVSHMGEFLIWGEDTLNYLNYLVPNDIRKIKDPGKGLYTQICNENGGTVDDLIIYNLGDFYLTVVNASNIEKDWAWFNNHKKNFNIDLKNTSENISLLAVQGPKSQTILSSVLNLNLEIQKYFEIKKYNSFYIARTGYTGEDGFEIFFENGADAISLWQKLIKAGVTPCGLGARDTLRIEATYPLYGNELDENTSPLEAGLGWSVKLDKEENFTGKTTLINQKNKGLTKNLVCLKINDRVIPRKGNKVFSKEKTEVGAVTSGCPGITLGYPVAIAYISSQLNKLNDELFIEIRDKLVPANIVQKPFYKRGR